MSDTAKNTVLFVKQLLNSSLKSTFGMFIKIKLFSEYLCALVPHLPLKAQLYSHRTRSMSRIRNLFKLSNYLK